MKTTPILKSLLYIIGFTIFCTNVFGFKSTEQYCILEDSLEIPSVRRIYANTDNQAHFESLKIKYGNKKIIPQHIMPQTLTALAHFPELIDVRIEFRIQKASMAHISRPALISLLLPKEKRTYLIIISNDLKETLEPSRHDNLDFNSQVGVLGHELSHTAHYLNKNSLEILWEGIRYVSENFRANYERETDINTIGHNLGYQLFEWSHAVHKTLEENGRGDHYLHHEEIREILKSHPNY